VKILTALGLTATLTIEVAAQTVARAA
jgi:hypothetical protein